MKTATLALVFLFPLLALFSLASIRDDAVLTEHKRAQEQAMQRQRDCVENIFRLSSDHVLALATCAKMEGVTVEEIERNLP